MNIETLELIHKLLTEHKDNASRCCDRARGKRNSTRDGSVIPPRIRLELSNGLVVERSGKNSALKVADPTGQRAGQQLPICQRDELHPCGADRFDSRPSAAGQKGAIVGRDFSRDSAVCQR